MSTLIKSAINYKVSCFVNFKTDKDGREFAYLQPKITQKNKDTNQYEDKKMLFLDEALALIDVLQRAITHAQDRLKPVQKIGSKYETETSSNQVQIEGQAQPVNIFENQDIPF